ncbi:MAG: hypothetical protein FWC16_00400 [Defluviitaleaceae bacterium]|nr:hypothetical protein [Defluviitaleaceae bacterium]MCL2273363.1 hypothetical protein [Defluviitaleaceae bacterium]
MKLHSLKRKVALWLALVMILNTLAPFFIPRMAVQVQASAAQRLEALTDRTMVGGTVESPGITMMVGPASNPEDIMLAWPIGMGELDAGLHVLRFFTEAGHKFEFWVRTHGDGETVDISYHLFRRASAADINASTNPYFRYNEPLPNETFDPVEQVHPAIYGMFAMPGRPQTTIRYRWAPPQAEASRASHMFVFIENGLSAGFIHDYTWEFYPEAQAALYADIAHGMHSEVWRPNTGTTIASYLPTYRPAAWPQFDANRSDRAYVFPGFRAMDVNVFPFAQAAYRDPSPLTPAGEPNYVYFPNNFPDLRPSGNNAVPVPHTLERNQVYLDRQRITSALVVDLCGDAGTDFPAYATHRLNMTSDPRWLGGLSPQDITTPVERPAMGMNGMDIRILLPRFFSEDLGGFVRDFNYGPPYGASIPPVNAVINMGTPNVGESFSVVVNNVGNLPLWSANGDAGNTAGTSLVAPANATPARQGNPIYLHDASLIETASTAVVDSYTLLRLQVNGLAPSIIYEQLSIVFTLGGDPPVLVNRTTWLNHGQGDLRLNTLLAYDLMPPIAGTMNVMIQPFRSYAGALLIGEYRLDARPSPHRNDPPIIVRFDGRSDSMQLPVLMQAGHPPSHYRVDFVQTGGIDTRSQTIIVLPEDRPGIGPPNGFQVVNESIQFAPMRLPAVQPPGSIADLNFDVQWQMGNALEIQRMFHIQGTEPPVFHNYVTIRYTLYRGTSPQTAEESATTLPFANIDVVLRLNTATTPPTVDIRYIVTFADGTAGFTTAWEPWTVISEVVFATVPFRNMPATHLNNPPNPTQEPIITGAPFRFPRVYHMYIAPIAEQLGGTGDGTGDFAPLSGWPVSVFDYIALSDFDRLQPPPPTNFMVRSQPSPEAPPALGVSFTVPTHALRAYMSQQYPFAPVVRFNVYLSAFEEAINNLTSPANDGRNDPARVLSVPFAANLSHEDGVNTVTLTDAHLNALRAGGQVLRIADIPLMPRVRFDQLNAWLPWDENNNLRAIQYTYDVLGQNPVPLPFDLNFTITGLDENQRYFLFADLVVERYVTSGAAFAGEFVGQPIVEQGVHVVARSVPGELAGDLTIGTPQVPGPIEVDPSAPTGLTHEGLDQTEVILHWHDIASEDPSVVAIEFEIVRTSDSRLNLAEYGSLPLGEIVRRNQSAKGWRTNYTLGDFAPGETERFLEVYSGNTSERITPMMNIDEHYAYDRYFQIEPPARVALFDRTLSPNNLYFYYVRTVRRVIFVDTAGERHVLENRSSWVEESVTTPVVRAPEDLRIENGLARPGFDAQSMQFVSWYHPATHGMIQALRDNPNAPLVFQYQLRMDDGIWGEVSTVPLNVMLNPDSFVTGRFYYMVRGLHAGVVYQMRVRVYDRDTGDMSVWSNIITFMTDWDDQEFQRDREANDWLEHLRRLLLEQLRRPFWTANDTPDLLRVVYRPDAFRGMIDATRGNAIQLHNTNARVSVYYLPVSGILEANEYRMGFTISHEDMDVTFAPRFINGEQNRAILEMARNVANRNVPVNDYFVRITMERQPIWGMLHGNPPLSPAMDVRIDLVGINEAMRNIRTWDLRVASQANQIVERRVEDPVIRQNVLNLIDRGDHLGERGAYIMLDYLATHERAVAQQISQIITRDIPPQPTAAGIISPTQISVAQIDAPMHLTATNTTPEMSVSAFAQIRAGANPEWQNMPTNERNNGIAVIAQNVGTYAFSGREVHIQGIENVPGGYIVTSLVARFGLADVFGGGEIDLHRNATRQMLTGSLARLAGAPPAADTVSWVANNMNVTLANRNAQGLVSQQEAVAMLMALYEQRTNTRVNSIIIRNHTHTAGMKLDDRYAQAVRAAFELGILQEGINPNSPITIGDWLDMLMALDTRVGL